jgi:hypothetical protein
MPRKPRFHLPDVPQHVIQRGNNRNPCFYAEPDYQCYLHGSRGRILVFPSIKHNWELTPVYLPDELRELVDKLSGFAKL